ncbi:Lrp/AsnC ligand binding domain-containing protein [Oryzifoliimicrobium ureilyticus]|uniref:Lrp/AsnC ligand binding domain-containing protein n=1 Tax=Oryzifoliimicrobium ureilyticus TaxID=3113724 RepID=UPI0030763551
MRELDRLDRKILRALQKEGRLSNIELAERVNLSPTATAERVKRLTRDGYITGYMAVLSPEKLGRSLLVFIQVKLDRTTPDIFDSFADAVRRSDDVIECHMVAGGFDYLVKARLAGMDDYRHFLTDVILSLPGVRETHTYAVMEEVKSTSLLPV